MKFFTTIITLFFTITALTALVNTFQQCQKEILNVTSACTVEVGEDRVQACSDSLSEKCQNFFSNPLQLISECQNSDGHYCAFGDVLITDKKLTEEDFKNTINVTCQSKKCISLTIEPIKNTINNSKYMKEGSETYLAWYKNGLEYLQSESCSTQATA